ncbi:MAG: hypothetical protein H0X24_05050 [Ktedonobacterales bacterium]|nr:hypothetical protein [Ktedonobacterales bacterium]
MSTPQENDSQQQDAQMPPDMGQTNIAQGQSQDATQQQLDQLRRVSDQDEVAQQNLDAVSGTPEGQLPGILSSTNNPDPLLADGEDDDLADDENDDRDIADVDDVDDEDEMTAADMAGQG